MHITKIRIILILVILLGFSGASFGVLYFEQNKIRAKYEQDQKEALARIEEVRRSRESYYETIAKSKEELNKKMTESKAQYDDLLARQKDIVADNVQTVTKTVQQTVPVTTTKPKSTSTTKKS